MDEGGVKFSQVYSVHYEADRNSIGRSDGSSPSNRGGEQSSLLELAPQSISLGRPHARSQTLSTHALHPRSLRRRPKRRRNRAQRSPSRGSQEGKQRPRSRRTQVLRLMGFGRTQNQRSWMANRMWRLRWRFAQPQSVLPTPSHFHPLGLLQLGEQISGWPLSCAHCGSHFTHHMDQNGTGASV